jgi:hypothetical protein
VSFLSPDFDHDFWCDGVVMRCATGNTLRDPWQSLFFPRHQSSTCRALLILVSTQPDMSDPSTLDVFDSTAIDSYRVLCKGCKSTLPLEMFLHKIDVTCYRVNVQCKRCLYKSRKNWRAHKDDIKAARATRERVCERITCVCGVSINTRYRVQHCKSKRHLSVVAILRQHNASLPYASALITPASTSAPTVERESRMSQQEFEQGFDQVFAAAEQEHAAYEALRSRRLSLPRSSDASTDDLAGELPCAGPAENAVMMAHATNAVAQSAQLSVE